MIIQILAGISLIIGSLIVFMNWYSLYISRKSGQFSSPVPILGPLFLAIGSLGFEQIRSYAWVGIIIDYGTIILIFSIPVLILEAWSKKK